MGFSVTQGDNMNITTDIIGLTRTTGNTEGDTAVDPPGTNPATSGQSVLNSQDNSRVVTWADSRMELRPGDRPERQFGFVHPSTGDKYIGGQHIRSYEVNINNNVERFYTLNRALFAQAIAPSKRDVTGSIVFLGRLQELGDIAFTNENFAYEDSYILFGFQPSVGSTSFIRRLPNVVFQIEEMSITNSLFETTVNWHSLPAARIDVVPTLGPTDDTMDPLLVDAADDLTPTVV